MPRYRIVWTGKRLVRAELVLEAATAEEARAAAELIRADQLHFSAVDHEYDHIVDPALRSITEVPAEAPRAGPAPAPAAVEELVEEEAWRPALG